MPRTHSFVLVSRSSETCNCYCPSQSISPENHTGLPLIPRTPNVHIPFTQLSSCIALCLALKASAKPPAKLPPGAPPAPPCGVTLPLPFGVPPFEYPLSLGGGASRFFPLAGLFAGGAGGVGFALTPLVAAGAGGGGGREAATGGGGGGGAARTSSR